MGVRIVVDAMGGDAAPSINLDGSLQALDASPDLSILLVGPEKLLEKELTARDPNWKSKPLKIVNADEVISMEDHGASVIRKKKGSSIHVGLSLLKSGDADAFISAGNSGAVMAGAFVLLGRIANVERPAITIKLPTLESFVVVLDAGANVDCKASHLAQFAEMGCVYAETIEGVVNPKVALLANGSENHKGNELTRETHALLEKTSLNYIGYVEGFDLFCNTADVVVCDGFVGNIALKLAEGLVDTAFDWFRREIKRDYLGLLGAVLLRKTLKRFKKKFDYEPYGAAPLLGIDGMVLISHGSSTHIAIRNGILTAKRGVEQQFKEKMARRLEQVLGEGAGKTE